jgi:magnesium chelatase family protein
VLTNAEADGKLLDSVAMPDADGGDFLKEAAEKLKLSARGYHRVLRVSRTLADIDLPDSSEKDPHVARHYIAKSLSYRRVVPL